VRAPPIGQSRYYHAMPWQEFERLFKLAYERYRKADGPDLKAFLDHTDVGYMGMVEAVDYSIGPSGFLVRLFGEGYLHGTRLFVGVPTHRKVQDLDVIKQGEIVMVLPGMTSRTANFDCWGNLNGAYFHYAALIKERDITWMMPCVDKRLEKHYWRLKGLQLKLEQQPTAMFFSRQKESFVRYYRALMSGLSPPGYIKDRVGRDRELKDSHPHSFIGMLDDVRRCKKPKGVMFHLQGACPDLYYFVPESEEKRHNKRFSSVRNEIVYFLPHQVADKREFFSWSGFEMDKNIIPVLRLAREHELERKPKGLDRRTQEAFRELQKRRFQALGVLPKTSDRR